MWNKEGLIIGTIITIVGSCSAFTGVVLTSIANGEPVAQTLFKGTAVGLPLVAFGLMSLLRTKGNIHSKK